MSTQNNKPARGVRSPTDMKIRQTFPARPDNTPSHKTVLASIEVIGGFELFNTRPYHNYETWGQGYRVTSQGVTVESEYLDDAIELWKQKAAMKCEPHK